MHVWMCLLLVLRSFWKLASWSVSANFVLVSPPFFQASWMASGTCKLLGAGIHSEPLGWKLLAFTMHGVKAQMKRPSVPSFLLLHTRSSRLRSASSDMTSPSRSAGWVSASAPLAAAAFKTDISFFKASFSLSSTLMRFRSVMSSALVASGVPPDAPSADPPSCGKIGSCHTTSKPAQ